MKYEKEAALKQFLPPQIHNKYSIATVLGFVVVFFFPIFPFNSVPGSGYRSHRVRQQWHTGLHALPLETTKISAATYCLFLIGKIHFGLAKQFPKISTSSCRTEARGADQHVASRSPSLLEGRGGKHTCCAGSPGSLGAAPGPPGSSPNMLPLAEHSQPVACGAPAWGWSPVRNRSFWVGIMHLYTSNDKFTLKENTGAKIQQAHRKTSRTPRCVQFTPGAAWGLRAKDELNRSACHTTEEPGPAANNSKVALLVFSRIV